MNEISRTGRELTGTSVSFRLNEAPLLNRGSFSMPEPQSPNEGSQENLRVPRRGGQGGRREGRAPETLAGLLGPQAGREAARALFEESQANNIPLTPSQRQFMRSVGFVPEGVEWEDYGDERSEQITRNGESFQTDRREAEGQERHGLVHEVGFGEVTDTQFKRTLDVFNHDIAERLIGDNAEHTLSRLGSTIKELTDRIGAADFPQEQYDSALEALDNLKQQELALMKRDEDPRSKRRNELYRQSAIFEQEFAEEIELDRIGEDIPDSPRKEQFRLRRQELVKNITTAIENAPSVEAARFDQVVMEMALKFRETRELLINEILFKPFEDKTEQGHYELNLYASGNLDELLAMLSRRGKEEKYKKDREIYQWYKAMRTTSRNFWEMNRGLWTGNLENFSRIAEEMNHDQFETMQKIPGVGEVARIYDEKFWSIIARDKRITSENIQEAKQMARDAALRLNDAGLLVSSYFDDREGTIDERRKLETWELDRALNVGYVFFNITFRGAELISLSQLQEGGFKFASWPQENVTRFLDPLRLTGERFTIGNERGGQDYLKRVKKVHQELMDKDGRHLGKNRLSQIGGAKVEDLEYMSMMGISGVFSSWRMTTAAMSAIRLDIDGEATDLKKYMVDKKFIYGHGSNKEVYGLQNYIGKIRDDSSLSLEDKQDAIVAALKPLIGENGALNIGFGMLLRLGQGNDGLEGFLSGPEGYKARQELWNRVAEKNPLMMINLLTNLEEKGHGGDKDHESHYSLKNLLKHSGWITDAEAGISDPSKEGFYLNNPRWQALKNKLELRQEHTLKKQNNPNFELTADISLTADEQHMVDSIKNAGKAISEDLADVVFPYMLFLNDMPYEDFTWAKTGAQYFKRRMGDIGSYNKAGSAAIGMLDNLGGLKPEDVIEKHLKEIERGIEGPNGDTFAFKAVMPFILAYVEMAETSSGIDQIGLIQEVKEFSNKPTSRLQKYAGTHAPSLSKKELYTFAHALHSAGVVGHHHVEELRKYKHFTFIDILISVLMNAAPVIVGEMVFGAIKPAGSLKAA